MNANRWFIAALLSASTAVQAETITERSVTKAQSVIEAAVAAHGGSERLNALETLLITHETGIHAVGQSLGTAPPWDVNENNGIDAIHMDDAVFVTTNKGHGGGFQFDNATVINGDDSYQVDYRAGTATPIAEPDFATTSGPFVRVTPALLLRDAERRAHTAMYLGEEERGERTYDVVGFSMEVGPAISLFVDRETGVLRHSERVLPGAGLVGYTFSDYETIDGIAFNRTFLLHLNGELNMDRRNTRIEVDEALGDVADVSDELARTEPLAPDPLTRQALADGVWLIGGTGTYAMFVEMSDHVIAVGATAGIPDRIASLREVVADKPIRYGVLTHQHFDHTVGVPTYVAEGATVVAASAHEQIVRDAAGEGAEFELLLVDDDHSLGDRTRAVEVIDIGPTAHTEHLLVTWLPDEGILFEADHFAMPRSGPVPPAVESTRSFQKALRKHRLKPEQIVSSHSPVPGTLADLDAAVRKKPATD